MTRSEMREEVASEENNLMLARRDLPMIGETLRRARSFRESVAELHCFSSGDIIENFLDAFDTAHSDAVRAYRELTEDM
jgi:hypothetical protein